MPFAKIEESHPSPKDYSIIFKAPFVYIKKTSIFAHPKFEEQ